MYLRKLEKGALQTDGRMDRRTNEQTEGQDSNS